jgi:hypothetical protein
MPKTPTGAKRPADVIGNAVHVMRIATGQIEEKPEARDPKAVARGAKGGAKGGKARAKVLSGERRKAIATNAAKTRWKASAHND